MINGRIDFTDRLVRPNYSAALTQLNGSLGPFRSDSPELAALSLKGRVAGTASLEVEGRLHPLTSPPSLDIKARATDLELAPLSPYSAKYVRYLVVEFQCNSPTNPVVARMLVIGQYLS